MDISEKYISMCNCPEIQSLKSLEQGNWFKKIYKDESWIICQGHYLDSIHEKDFEDKDQQHIWLPRQDQLQEIIGIKDLLSFIEDNEYMSSLYSQIKLEYDRNIEILELSPEIFWLCVVMNYKFNKTWDNEKWN